MVELTDFIHKCEKKLQSKLKIKLQSFYNANSFPLRELLHETDVRTYNKFTPQNFLYYNGARYESFCSLIVIIFFLILIVRYLTHLRSV